MNRGNRMKKILALLLMALLVLSLAACGSGGGNSSSQAESSQQPSSSEDESSSKLEEPSSQTPSGASQEKAEGAQMEPDAANASSYAGAIELSGLSDLGKPVNYTFNRVEEVNKDRHVIGLIFTSNLGEPSAADLYGYAKAIWNLCIDNSDDGVLYSRLDDKVRKEKSMIKEPKKDNQIYSWYYLLNDEVRCAKVYSVGGYLISEFSKDN